MGTVRLRLVIQPCFPRSPSCGANNSLVENKNQLKELQYHVITWFVLFRLYFGCETSIEQCGAFKKAAVFFLPPWCIMQKIINEYDLEPKYLRCRECSIQLFSNAP